MFVDDDHDTPPEDIALPVEIEAASLLAACAAEAERQSEGLRQLDAALGAALVLAQRPVGSPHGPNATESRALISALAADLQQADRLRQEAEGLARALALLANRPKGAGRLTADQIRRCTPILALQRRLLSHCG